MFGTSLCSPKRPVGLSGHRRYIFFSMPSLHLLHPAEAALPPQYLHGPPIDLNRALTGFPVPSKTGITRNFWTISLPRYLKSAPSLNSSIASLLIFLTSVTKRSTSSPSGVSMAPCALSTRSSFHANTDPPTAIGSTYLLGWFGPTIFGLFRSLEWRALEGSVLTTPIFTARVSACFISSRSIDEQFLPIVL